MSFSYENLWVLAKQRGLSKTELGKQVGITSTTLAKLSKDEYISMNVLNRICNKLNCEISDVITHKKEK